MQRREVEAFHLEILLPDSPHHRHTKPPPHWTRSAYKIETEDAHKRCDLTFPTAKACPTHTRCKGKADPLIKHMGQHIYQNLKANATKNDVHFERNANPLLYNKENNASYHPTEKASKREGR